MLPIFTLVGDSNIRRHMSPLSCREPHMSGAEVNICGKFEAFSEVLRSTRSSSTVVVIACLTNFLTASEDSGSSVALRVGPVLSEFREVVLDYCQEQPDRLLQLSIFLLKTQDQFIYAMFSLSNLILLFHSSLLLNVTSFCQFVTFLSMNLQSSTFLFYSILGT